MATTKKNTRTRHGFELWIDLGNADMNGPLDVAYALDRVAAEIRDDVGQIEDSTSTSAPVRDTNGNRVGQWSYVRSRQGMAGEASEALAQENPTPTDKHPMGASWSTGQKVAMGAVAAGVLGGLAWWMYRAMNPPLPGGSTAGSLGGPITVHTPPSQLPPAGGTSDASSGSVVAHQGGHVYHTGQWMPVTTLKHNGRYRVSADVRGALEAAGYKIWTDHDTIPTDWPTTDLDPARWRAEGVWPMADMTLPANLGPYGNPRIYEWTV